MESGRSDSRTDWVDSTRGIGTLLIILAHTHLASDWIGDYIDTFRTTLFFFISGCLFSLQGNDKFSFFMKKKMRTILIPYFVFALISFLYCIFRFSVIKSEYHNNLSLYKQFFGIFYSAGTTQWMDFNLPLWFLTCLFIVQIMFYLLIRTIRTRKLLIGLLILFSIAGYADGLWNTYRLPWGVDVALTAIVFFGFGHLLFPFIQSLLLKPIGIRMVLAGLLCLPNLLISDPLMNINMKLHGHYFDFYFEAFAGITFCILVANLIGSRLLSYLGRNALILTAAHMPMLGISARIMQQIGFITNYYAVELIRVLLTILMTLPLIYLIHKYPFMIGKDTKRWPRSPTEEKENKRWILS